MKESEQDYQDALTQDEQRYEDSHTKRYKVVRPDIVDPNDPLGSQEPIEDEMHNEIRDLVNVNDDADRFMANPEDFDKVGEILTEDDFYLETANYIDEQGNLGNAEFAMRK